MSEWTSDEKQINSEFNWLKMLYWTSHVFHYLDWFYRRGLPKIIPLLQLRRSPSPYLCDCDQMSTDTKTCNETKTSVTTVVRLKRVGGVITQDCDVYIGRRLNMGGWALKDSKWRNPYTVKDCKGGVSEAVRNFELRLHTRVDLLSVLQSELGGRVLGCWCKKKHTDLCHGDVLARLANGPVSTITALIADAPTAPAAPPIPAPTPKKKRNSPTIKRDSPVPNKKARKMPSAIATKLPQNTATAPLS